LDQRFGKKYKLCSKKKIAATVREGFVVKEFPFFSRCLLCNESKGTFQVVFVVPKKKFRLATTRNRIRRYIRESVRLEKSCLESALKNREKELSLFLLYNGDVDINLIETRKSIKKLFKKIIHEIENQ
jgi:ribonuclease P protein component